MDYIPDRNYGSSTSIPITLYCLLIVWSFVLSFSLPRKKRYLFFYNLANGSQFGAVNGDGLRGRGCGFNHARLQ